MIFETPYPKQDTLRQAILHAYRLDETTCVNQLLESAELTDIQQRHIHTRAADLVRGVREVRKGKSLLDSFLYEYDLSSEEGITLMCLAEALLRIPDTKTIDSLIRDKVGSADWKSHAGQSSSMFINAATWGLMLTGKVLGRRQLQQKKLGGTLQSLVRKSSMPVVRKMVSQAMKMMGEQFVMGRNIDNALKRAKTLEKQGYCYSYDMLGEAARTAEDAERYMQSYSLAIQKIGEASNGRGVIEGPGISVKLSALHPRYEFAQRERVLNELTPRLLSLAQQAKQANIGFTVDAEEAERLDLSLDIIEKVFTDASLSGWEGFGLAIQSYQKRAFHVIDWLAQLARSQNRRIMIRLIKGAYWDSEIKRTQEMGLEGYPVFSRKMNTDVSFIACAKKIIDMPDAFYPQFATHNASSLATILELIGTRQDFEFQCLHGMGQALYDQVVGSDKLNRACRIYAPVGQHEDLLPYLVRRLLENGANSSFVNRIADDNLPIEDIIEDPITKVKSAQSKAHSNIPLPKDMYGDYRNNSQGIDLTDPALLTALAEKLTTAVQQKWFSRPLINGREIKEETIPVYSPSNTTLQVGEITHANEEHLKQALKHAVQGFVAWSKHDVEERAQCLEKLAALIEQYHADLMSLAIREAGKTLPDAIAEIREAVDFCYYYANQARKLMGAPTTLPGPTGETNSLELHGRGVVACISPWNFPLAIFVGQIVAALVTGNSVIAKPAEQTSLIASFTVKLMHEAGIPSNVIQLLPGRGEVIGAGLVADERVKAVIFTGSTETARAINQTLANRSGAIIPLIAETGGQNTMLVDSSALLEQVVVDVVSSAFGSAGQRCSALRVLFVQNDVADKMIHMLCGAMAELNVSNPEFLNTDIGPVIDDEAKKMLETHCQRMQQEAKLIYEVPLSQACLQGSYVAPRAYEISGLQQLPREVFGPILHVIRYDAKDLDKVIDSINNTGYGLTLGIQSRVNEAIDYIQQRVNVGNTYVNRNMIGAVVGVQPFGGEGLSGTGPKAGGPHYLARLCNERTTTVNTTAAGGNTTLLTLAE